MKLNYLKMNNWCSFYGEHKLDFSSSVENASYAIFGQIGKGKSSTVAALEWVLFGKVMDTIDDGDDHILRRIRPIIDKNFFDGKEMSFALPLLSDTAYREGDYTASVEIGFSHNEKFYLLKKEVRPLSKPPKQDSDIEIWISLSIDGNEISNSCPAEEFHLENKIQPYIEEIIPQDVSRFFFVKGDAIREFTGLIFGSGSNPKLRNDVNSVVGLPALTRSLEDIRRLRTQAEDEANSVASKKKGNEKIQREIDGYKLMLKRLREGYLDDNYQEQPGISKLKKRREVIQSKITEIESQLGEREKIRNLLSKRETLEDELSSRIETLPNTVNLYRQSVNNSWKIIIQNRVNESVLDLRKQSQTEKSLTALRYDLDSSLQLDKHRLEHAEGSVPCPTCHRDLEKLTEEEKKSLTSEIKEKETQMRKLSYELESVKGSDRKLTSLIQFRTDLTPDSISALENKIKEERNKIQEIEGLIAKCSEALIQIGGTEGFENLTSDLKKREKDLILIDEEISYMEHEVEIVLANLGNERGKLKNKTQDLEMNHAEDMLQSLEWFQNVWEKSLTVYREHIRKSIDRICTERFMAWVDSPEKYSRVETTDDWGLQVYGADNNWAPLANPGHRQLLSICFIEALRYCSNVRFPMIFDNPGAAIDQETIESVLDYYFSSPPGQFLALAHSGGMREAEIQLKYDKFQSHVRSWRIEYESGDKRHSKFSEA